MYIKSLDNLIDLIKTNNYVYSYGIIKEVTGDLIDYIFNQLNLPVFVMSENDKKARSLYEELSQNSDRIRYFPDLDTNYQLVEDLDYTNKFYRMQTIISFLNNEKVIIISSPKAINRRISPKENFLNYKIKINLNSEIDIDKLISKLNEMGYTRKSIVESKGEYSIRGDIIDIFQIHEENPTRLELFDIEVDSIRKFDVNTQLSIDKIENFEIYPLKEIFYSNNEVDNIVKNIKKDLIFTRNKLGENIYDTALTKFNRIIEKLETNSNIENIDLIVPYIKNNNFSLIDFLSKDSLIIFDDISNIEDIVDAFEKFRNIDIQDRVENGDLLKSHHNIFIKFNDLFEKFKKFKNINLSSLLKNTLNFNSDSILDLKIRENENFHGKFNEFISDIKFRIKNNYKIIIYTPDKNDAKNLKENLAEFNLYASINENIPENLEDINIVLKYKHKGYDFYSDRVNILSYEQIFRKVNKKKIKSVKNKDIINYSDLVIGDLLVHDDYGIAVFKGIKNIELNGVISDFIELRYMNDDKLFVPTTEMDKVSKFIGNGDKKPKLSSLSSIDWKKSKAKAKKEIEKIAQDLVELYAKRSQIKGFEYSKDTPWQREFEDSFIFEETSAQLRAIEEIKQDMESNKVMDRLLCGDVGYGKTEVALRAAFKAIMDGKQVVMLAPTTILVKQHLKNMISRFKDFPIKIDYLSRFKTIKQRDDTIKLLKKGYIDFIVGTHALLCDNVKFKNLGLLIVDEEQRFGVRHKEKIKQLSKDIDVLTLSATPIPRTLQMSLTGIRDMSILDEHPENRLPVNTYVMEFDSLYIREAILREIARGGQVYFVYNRVETIDYMYRNLVQLLPEINIAISHGQMSTRVLENVLEDFTNKKYDLLLTTTIIETGMDIQNVNTIIIYNADKMGLSQLYQLKGRIGRSDRNSYAYFTYQKEKPLTEIAEKRLKAIKDFSELGSGYKVAMRDLELRGAGNLLGESQSGHIESIGYDLYVRMLTDTINQIKGEQTFIEKESVKIELKVDLYIPNKYILDENEKINIYKKISSIEDKSDYYSIIDELVDRFGDIPISVQNIIDISMIKSLMIKNNLSELIEEDGEIKIIYNNLEIFDFEKLKKLVKYYKYDIRFDMRNKPTIILSKQENYFVKLIELLNLILKINGGKNEEI